MTIIRVIWRSLFFTAVLLCGIVLTPLIHHGNMPRHSMTSRITCAWHRWVARALGVKLRIEGQPPDQAALYVANHISWFDITALGACLPLRFLSKAEVRRWPLIGWLATRAGTLYIERGNHQTTAEANRRMQLALQNDENVCLFPEGATTDGHIRKFHSRLMQCAIDAGRPVQPVAIIYPPPDQSGQLNHPAVLFVGNTTMAQSFSRMLRAKTIEARIRLLAPIDTTNKTRNEIATLAQQAVGDAIAELAHLTAT